MGHAAAGGVSPADPVEGEAARPELRLFWRALLFFRPYAGLGLLALVGIGAESALGIVPALVTREVIDLLTQPDASFGRIAQLVMIGIAAAAGVGLVGSFSEYLRTKIGQGIMLELRNRLVDRLLGQSLGFFADRRSGDIISRMNNDVGGVQGAVESTVFGLIESVLIAGATLTVMFFFDWRLTLFVVVLLPAFALPARAAAAKTYQTSVTIQERLSDITARMQEVLGISGALLVKAFGTEARERVRLHRLNKELYDLDKRKMLIERYLAQALGVMHTFGPSLIWLYGGYQVIQGNSSLGTMITFITVLVPRLYGSFNSLGNLHVKVAGALALFQRLFAYLDLKPNVAEAPGAAELPKLTGSVAFEKVIFSYAADLPPALDGVSFRIEPGQLVALVGPSGAGKTTLTSLLCRFYDPQNGRILLDGHDLRDLKLSTMGRHFGIVFQETFLFHASIRDNLLYAKPEADQAELDEAVAAARLDDVIARLPAGYDTVVGERGFRLSGGEKQRLAIARVILKNPRLLILDEATSHLDSVSEQLIQTALKSLFVERTSLVIAHRLSTILAADMILVLDRGRIVEHGTHHELLRSDGLYHQLYERQYRDNQ